jgi:hypothetical protein
MDDRMLYLLMIVEHVIHTNSFPQNMLKLWETFNFLVVSHYIDLPV